MPSCELLWITLLCGPNMHITFFPKASAIVLAWWLGRGIAKGYFVKLSGMVIIYKFPDLVSGSGPTTPTDISSKAVVPYVY